MEAYNKECSNATVSVLCDTSDKYRTINGSCNNLKHPEWGMSETAQHRYLKAEYDDGM